MDVITLDTPTRPAARPPVPRPSVAEAVDAVRLNWGSQRLFTPATLEKCGQTVARFGRRLQAQGVTDMAQVGPEHCSGFIDARTPTGDPPELTTRHHRRSSLRMLFRTLRDLGHDVGDPTLDLDLPPRAGTGARPLSDLEVSLCRASARMGEAGGRSLHRAVCWALGETTAVTSEISAIRLGDLDDPTGPRWVHLPGTRRHDARSGELTDWGSRILTRWVEAIPAMSRRPDHPLVYRGAHQPGQPAAQSAVCNALGQVLDLAGLSDQPNVRPASLRNWAGRSLYDGGMPIEQVARRMGSRSLDTVATDIALTWRAE